MATLSTCFLFVLYFSNISGYDIIDDGEDADEIVWPQEYYFRGERMELYTDTNEPFEIWHSAERNRSRKDVNYGTDQTYYLADEADEVKVFPITTEEQTNELQCEVSRLRGEQVDFLPDTSGFVYSGEATIEDKKVGVWKFKEKEKLKLRVEKILYVYKTDSGIHIPVQIVKKELNLANGQIESHVITNFYGFNDTLEDSDFEIDTSDCERNWSDSSSSEEASGGELRPRNAEPDVLRPRNAEPDELRPRNAEPDELELAFRRHQQLHGRTYHIHEHDMRKSIFEQNWRMVHEHNRKNSSFTLTLNQFSDLTAEELRQRTGLLPPEGPGGAGGRGGPARASAGERFPHSAQEVQALAQDLPASYDLRFEGYISPVKSQGRCGSCWAFAAAAAVEGATALANGARLLDLSEQSLVDCAWGFDNFGCAGGHLEGSLKYVVEHGIPLEKDYGPYIQNNGYCDIANMSETFKIKGFVAVTPRSAGAVKLALRRWGPVAAALNAQPRLFHYQSGIFYDDQCEVGAKPNHGVAIVGYGARDGDEFWVVKNSWGARWGEGGFLLLAARGNDCGLLDSPYAVLV